MDQEEFSILLSKYLDGTASPDEKKALESFYLEKQKKDNAMSRLDEDKAKQVWQEIDATVTETTKSHYLKKILWTAACVIAILTVSVLLIQRFSNSGHSSIQEQSLAKIPDTLQADAPPAGNKAQLILANGNRVILSGDTVLRISDFNRLENGVLVCNTNAVETKEKYAFQTLIVPRGGQFQLELMDGTKIWLNAASKIRFPAAFEEGDRKVYLMEGEAFFEVAKQNVHGKRIPFVVDVRGEEVQVLGTSFNVNAYQKNKVFTALVEGSIQVRDQYRNRNQVIKPGEESSISKEGIEVYAKDVKQMDAWRRGIFSFSPDMKLIAILEELGRWYDFEIVMPNKPIDKTFEGKVSKKLHASKIIDMLNYSGIKCTLINTPNGKKLIVKP